MSKRYTWAALLSILVTLQRFNFVSQHCAVAVLRLIRKCLANLSRLLKWFGILTRPLGHIKCMVENWIVCTVAKRAEILRSTLLCSVEWVLCVCVCVFCECDCWSFWSALSVSSKSKTAWMEVVHVFIHVCVLLCIWAHVFTLCMCVFTQGGLTVAPATQRWPSFSLILSHLLINTICSFRSTNGCSTMKRANPSPCWTTQQRWLMK